MNETRVKLLDSTLKKGQKALKKKEFSKAFNLFSKSLKFVHSNNERAQSLQMIGVCQYCLGKLKDSEKSLALALNLATDNDLVDLISYDLAMTNLLMNKFWITHDNNMSWLIRATRIKRWAYMLKSTLVSIKTKDKTHMSKIIPIIIGINRQGL